MNLSKIASMLGKKGGEQSVKSRFKNKSKEEISELMRKVRLTKAEKKEFSEGVDEMVKNLRKESLKEKPEERERIKKMKKAALEAARKIKDED